MDVIDVILRPDPAAIDVILEAPIIVDVIDNIGMPGPMGPPGVDGGAGAVGPAGPVGPAGSTGATGPTGATGATGTAGATGPQGVAGPTGATGPAGPAGATGPAGPAGTSASITISDTAPSSPTAGQLWWCSAVGEGQLYIYYNDGTSSQWVLANGAAASLKYAIGFSYTGGVLGASQLLGLHRVAKNITIPANFGPYFGQNSQAGGTANATGSTVISVDRALAASPTTFAQIGTITIAAGTITPTFATAAGAAITCAQGDVIRLQGPSSADATLANFYATLVAQEA